MRRWETNMNIKIKYTYLVNGKELERIYRIEDIEQGVAKCDKGEKIVKREVVK